MRGLALTLTLFAATAVRAGGYYNLNAFWRGKLVQQNLQPAWVGEYYAQAAWDYGGISTTGPGDAFLNLPHGVAQDGTYLYVVEYNNNRVSRFNLSTGAFLGWLGKIATSPTGGDSGCSGATVGTFTPGWCLGGTPTPGTDDGFLTTPRGAAVDASSLYVVDSGNHRINKYALSSGAFQGWVGGILTSPTGGAVGCNGAAVGTSTPGWCKGGTATSGNFDGALNNPLSVAVSGGSVYVGDHGNSRVSRYDAVSGAFSGWIGKYASAQTTFATGGTPMYGLDDGMFGSAGPRSVYAYGSYLYVGDNYVNVTPQPMGAPLRRYSPSGEPSGWLGMVAIAPTGGAAGCTTTSGSTLVPGWCYGGRGTATGMLVNTAGTPSVSDGVSLYVMSNWMPALLRFDLATGAYTGWIGLISASPTGGDPGCNGAASSTQTPGWCKGGTQSFSVSNNGTGSWSSNGVLGLAIVGSYLYSIDMNYHAIKKFYTADGSFMGWIGKIATSPTGGDAGCNGATVGSFTPGWCKGGASGTGTGDGMLASPRKLVTDGSFLYAADTGNHRVNRYDPVTGAFTGWIGKIATSPTGGDAGCSGAAANTATPGWCLGGTSGIGGNYDGTIALPQGLAISGTNLYISSNGSNVPSKRIMRYTLSTGTFTGWIGGVGTSPTGGDAGCNGASVATFTPGWCMGGASQTNPTTTGLESIIVSPSGLAADETALYLMDDAYNRLSKYDRITGAYLGWVGGNGGIKTNFSTGGLPQQNYGPSTFGVFLGITGLGADGSNLYVFDGNARVQRFDLTGNYTGWIGGVNGTPTGGAAGCTGTTSGFVTPGWCLGGSSASSSARDGHYSGVNALSTDGANLYISDSTALNRVSTTGAYLGWLGRIATAPTGGSAGCAGAAVGSVTPGWCSGGTAQSGAADGMLNSAVGNVSDGSFVYVTDSNNMRVERFGISSGIFSGWIGGNTLTKNFGTGGVAIASSLPGGLNTPKSVYVYGTNLYVADQTNHRLDRYSTTNGVYLGWVGYLNTAPTSGDVGCAGTSGVYSPGWCLGGTGGGNFSNPAGVTGDGTYLYVTTQTGAFVARFTLAGVYSGWMGKVASSPTGGDPGCSGASVGTTPAGWCLGGTAAAGTGDGAFTTPEGILADGSYLYVGDSGNFRVSRHTLSGGFLGWIGGIGSSPTGGGGTCSGATGYTPAWCYGGTGTTATGNGSFNTFVRGLASDGSNLYVADGGNHRISRYSLTTGAFTGWTGRINSAPTGGDVGCSGATGTTRGWCMGGTGTLGAADGQFNAPAFLHLKGTDLFVADAGNFRAVRLNAPSSIFRGWIGKIGTSPTGGDVGCNGATVGTLTPGWCKGGAGATGTGDGMLAAPRGIFVSGTNLYMSDFTNNRVIRYNVAP